MTCSSCGEETPDGNFCTRCGAPLGSGFSGPSRRRTHFAAAPHESVTVPRLISTLFPQLPRDSHRSYRLAFALGIAAVIVLAALRLFPVALIAAALLLPVLVVLYLVDVNVYEDEPVWAMSLTMGWGAAAGIGFGLLALAVAPPAAAVIVNGASPAWPLASCSAGPNPVFFRLVGCDALFAWPSTKLRSDRFRAINRSSNISVRSDSGWRVY